MDALVIYVITERPKDFPGHFVVRRQTANGGTILFGEARLFDSLEEARKFAGADGRVVIPRDERDDPVIVESWI